MARFVIDIRDDKLSKKIKETAQSLGFKRPGPYLRSIVLAALHKRESMVSLNEIYRVVTAFPAIIAEAFGVTQSASQEKKAKLRAFLKEVLEKELSDEKAK